MKVIFVEMSWFTQRLKARLGDSAYRRFQEDLLKNPERWGVMPGCGGLRKARFSDESRGKGKRGGVRIIYLWIPEAFRIDLFDIYGKDEKDDLSSFEKRELTMMLKQVRAEAVQRYRRSGGNL